MAAYCAEKLAEMGFSVSFDASAAETGSDTGNLIAHLPGTVPGRVAFSAHLDTVKPCAGIEAVIEQRHICDEVTCRMAEVVCSAGDTILSADDKAGIAAIFEGMRSVVESGALRPDITVLLTTCEEQSLLGSSALTDDALAWPADLPAASRGTAAAGLLDDVAVAAEPVPLFVLDADGAPGTIIMGAPYHWTLRARIKGRAAHAGVEPEEGVSAIQIASAAVAAMPLGRIDECTTANVGRIEGGVAVNIVPAACELEGECRSLYEDRVLAQRDAMTAALEDAAAQLGGTVEVALRTEGAEAVLSVRNSGEPIAKEDLPHLFDRFYRADKARTQAGAQAAAPEGYGLGLAIAADIAQAHKGALTVSSTAEEGTVFTLRLPLA